MVFDVDELLPPGDYAVREPTLQGRERQVVKQSLLDRPEKACLVLCTNLLVASMWCRDLYWDLAVATERSTSPTSGVEGPLTISANNMFCFYCSHSCRRI